MSMSNVLNLLPALIREQLRNLLPKRRLAAALAPYLPPIVCVDVGASYYAHPAWRIFRDSPQTRWIAVEPNQENLDYVARWPHRCAVRVCAKGLSRQGGTQTLHITNVDSGSSLLPPVVPESQRHRVLDLNYLFPVREQQIETVTLDSVMGHEDVSLPAFVKLDTQGTELSILQGAINRLQSNNVVGIETEATLLAEPVMQGSGKFWEVCQFLELLGYELIYLKPIHGTSRFGGERPKGRTFLNECDAAFAVRADVAAGLDVSSRVALVAFYISYELYEEAFALLERDADAVDSLTQAGCDVDALQLILRKMM